MLCAEVEELRTQGTRAPRRRRARAPAHPRTRPRCGGQVKELQGEAEKLGEDGEVEKAEEVMKKIQGLVSPCPTPVRPRPPLSFHPCSL